MIVAGEIGPTETRLALCGLDVGRPVVVAEETARNSAFAGFGAMVQRFLQKYRPPQIRAAGFVASSSIQRGAAGSPWPVEARALASELAIDRVVLLTDAEAIAHALPALGDDELTTLNGSDASGSGNQAVLTIGASPGVAGSYWNGTEHRPFASEAGDADFAPGTEDELRLALHLSASVERVTLGLLLSPAGLALMHAFVRDGREPVLTKVLEGAEILREATSGTDAACRRALGLFLGICGSAARNLTLTFRATGGLYLGGDLVPGLRALLAKGSFQEGFCRKGPLQDFARKIPVVAVLNPKAALLGAATVAARELRTQRGSGWAS
jgi:glucokinase